MMSWKSAENLEMKWSYKIARIAGTDVKIHLTFLMLLAYIALSNLKYGAASAIFGVVFVVLVFGCILLHEFGHVFAARKFGIRTPDVTLYPIGGVARLERMPERPVQELIVALAGPAVNVVIAAALSIVLIALGIGVSLTGVGGFAFGGLSSLIVGLVAVNVWLVLFNMIPAFPMDGGRVLRALLAMRMSYARATRIAAKVGRALAVVAGAIGVFYSPMLVFIAIFIYFAAGQEAAAADWRERNSGFFQTDAPRPIDPRPGFGSSRGEVVPVMDESGRVIGYVRR